MGRYIRLILTKLFCLFSEKYNAEWDKQLRKLISTNSVVSLDRYTIGFATGKNEVLQVWIANRFYAYGHAHTIINTKTKKSTRLTLTSTVYRPSMKTMILLDDLVSSIK